MLTDRLRAIVDDILGVEGEVTADTITLTVTNDDGRVVAIGQGSTLEAAQANLNQMLQLSAGGIDAVERFLEES